jgi:hypothetical protein
MTEPQPCPGSCNASWRKAAAAYEADLEAWLQSAQRAAAAGTEAAEKPVPPDARPTPGAPLWCGRCRGRINSALAQLDDLQAIVRAGIDGHRPPTGGDRVSGSAKSHSPDPRVDLLDELLRDLLAWEDDYRDAQGFPTREQRGRAHVTLTRCTAWLGVHLDGLLARTDPYPDSRGVDTAAGVLFGRLVLGWQRRLEAASATTPDALRKPGRCDRCGCATLWLVEADRPDERRVECRGFIPSGRAGVPDRECKKLYTLGEYDALTGSQVPKGGAA